MKESIGERIRRLRTEASLSQQRVADAVGVSRVAVTKWESGQTKDMRHESLIGLAKLFGITLGELLSGVSDVILGTATASYAINVEPIASSRLQYPLISWVQAGTWSEIVDAYPRGDGECSLFAQNQHGPHTFALRIVGDSMEPEFREGDVIFVDPDVAPKAGSYVVAKNNEEEATFKKYRSRGKDAEGNEVFELVPLNENYATLRSDREPIAIIGVVVEHTRVFRV